MYPSRSIQVTALHNQYRHPVVLPNPHRRARSCLQVPSWESTEANSRSEKQTLVLLFPSIALPSPHKNGNQKYTLIWLSYTAHPCKYWRKKENCYKSMFQQLYSICHPLLSKQAHLQDQNFKKWLLLVNWVKDPWPNATETQAKLDTAANHDFIQAIWGNLWCMQVMTRTDKDHHLQAHGPSKRTRATVTRDTRHPM